jgi:ribose-phosphate pyrophosphokinase
MSKYIANNGIVFAYTNGMEFTATKAAAELKTLGIRSITLSPVKLTRFPCREVKPKILENVRGKEVFLFFDFNGEPNDCIWNLLLTCDALHLADARSITPVVPYLPYLRQDIKDESRVPISASRLIRSIEACPSVRRLITIDMHADQLQAVFTIPIDHLPGRVIFTRWAQERFAGNFDKLVAVAPDLGSAKRVRKFASDIHSSVKVAILEKERDEHGVEIHNIIGADVAGSICLINDDIIDTGGTLALAINALQERGAELVIATGTHAVFSPKNGTTAYQKLADCGAEVVVTDSLITEKHSWLKVLPLYQYLANVIFQNVTFDGSVSKLINEGLPS